MSTMPGMPMPGDWTMSMMWMRMPGQTWAGAAASFTGMWVVMMAAMMLPSFVPMLWRYRQAVLRANETRLAVPAALVSIGYFFVWTSLGLALFPLGAMLAAFETEVPALARAVPAIAAVVVVVAGAMQFTPWKAHHLACCRMMPGRDGALSAGCITAWRQGLRFGFHCCLSCANLTAVLLVAGIMDLHAMIAVTAAITAERLAPNGERVARAIGAVIVGVGVVLMV